MNLYVMYPPTSIVLSAVPYSDPYSDYADEEQLQILNDEELGEFSLYETCQPEEETD